MTSADPINVYRIELDDDGSPAENATYCRLPPPDTPYVLRFKVIAGSLASNQGVVWTNYPPKGKQFNRNEFYKHGLTGIEPECDLLIAGSGAFEYYVEHSPFQQDGTIYWNRSETGYFVVDPQLTLTSTETSGVKGRPATSLPLEGLVIESVVPKWMGKLSEWTPHLETISKSGYNMIHFVPLQYRGISNSPYSIFDQLKFDPSFFEDKDLKKSEDEQRAIVKAKLTEIETKYGALSLTDIVWNHTACNSTWLWDHPEGGYNLHNSPHLIPAFELDSALLAFSAKVADPSTPFTADIKSENELKTIMTALRETVFEDIKLWEFYVLDVLKSLEEFKAEIAAKKPYSHDLFNHDTLTKLTLKEKADTLREAGLSGADEHGDRHHKKILPNVAVAYMSALLNIDFTKARATETVYDEYKKILNEVNLEYYKAYDKDVETIITNIENRVKYMRLDEHGPRLGPITEENPLVETYFTRLPENERTAVHPSGSLALVNNGWIWNADPLRDFAGKDSHAYLRREVIIWGDCVKLRYGKGPEDVPWLWERMKEYTIQSARLFHGFRIDNCHSTPIHLAQYLLDAARTVRPNLYVVAELFTGSEAMDIRFVSRLGINSLIREAMQAWEPRELSRLVHRHGISPVGCMDRTSLCEDVPWTGPDGKTMPSRVTPLVPSHPHALFMDCTHDNETPNQKRRAEDTLSNAGLVCMTSCAIGSVKGYDELYPTLLNLVTEKRHYATYKDPMAVGITSIKARLNNLHTKLALEGFEEAHVHHENEYIIVHRQQTSTLKGYILIAHTSFYDNPKRGDIMPIKLRDTTAKVIFSVGLEVTSRTLEKNDKLLEGLPGKIVELEHPKISSQSDNQGAFAQIEIPDRFPGGSIILLETSVDSKVPTNIEALVKTIPDNVFGELGWMELNIVLYRCDGEEQDLTPGNGVYNIPNHGQLVYCGLEGFVSVLKPIIETNDLGHPFCAHLRDGHWALDYIRDRIQRHLHLFPALKSLLEWYTDRMGAIKKLPNYLVPRYFALATMTAYEAARNRAYSLMPPLIQHGDYFTKSLALTALQVYSFVDSASLHPTKKTPSLAAGLPHFTYRHMRTWGRDVFISLRGILLVTGQFDAAKEHILAFASSLKHGMIPNLLDSLRSPRYNSRDSVWWFFQSVQDYCSIVPNGEAILKESFARRFPDGQTFVEYTSPEAYSVNITLEEILTEILVCHANGIHYREWNAGHRLDEQMSDKGFQVDVDLDFKTGFVTGGSIYNCGTWMDKMGESAKAGTKGVPATPRDGADVEIIGLLKSSLRWVNDLHTRGKFALEKIDIGETRFKGKVRPARTLTLKEWEELIQKNFEKYFYVPTNPEEDSQYVIASELVNRRGMYKDTYGSITPFADYQLRCNFPVAMCVAPELFDKTHAMGALELAKEVILGPLGMRTLDPADWAYRPNYDNSNDSDDRMIAKGWNYHQGPEWLWCTGYFFRAYLLMRLKCDPDSVKDTVFELHRMMLPHKAQVETSPWAGLAELTNLNGAICVDACQSQAWSSSTLLDLLHDIDALRKDGRLKQ
ncbi:MAG: glycoside hydrolase family 13 protein [Linnemannia elongata]|nr:MAG: glycoside hydrolase family 13 protein [Linnemannia elongata]